MLSIDVILPFPLIYIYYIYCTFHQGPFIPVLNMLFLPVTEKVFTIMPPTQGNLIPQTSDELERLDLEKSFLLFLNQIVSSQEYSLILVAEGVNFFNFKIFFLVNREIN